MCKISFSNFFGFFLKHDKFPFAVLVGCTRKTKFADFLAWICFRCWFRLDCQELIYSDLLIFSVSHTWVWPCMTKPIRIFVSQVFTCFCLGANCTLLNRTLLLVVLSHWLQFIFSKLVHFNYHTWIAVQSDFSLKYFSWAVVLIQKLRPCH